MIILSLVKASGIRTSVNSFNLVWEMFWQQVEACTAVIMVSLTAFRSIFISNMQRIHRKSGENSIIQNLRKRLMLKKGPHGVHQSMTPSAEVNHAPHVVPHVTLGTMFRSAQKKDLLDSQLQPITSDESTLHTKDPGTASSSNDIDLSGSFDSDTHMDSGPGQLSRDGSHDEGRNSHKHWWQLGIISGIALSKSTKDDSSF